MPGPDAEPVFLADLAKASVAARERGGGLRTFLADPATRGLRKWPKDVVHQWLYDHADGPKFQADYGHIDLSTLVWSLEPVALDELMAIPTGASETDAIEYYAQDPERWVSLRDKGDHTGVREMWDVHGTWKRWPILIERRLVRPGQIGLQVIEGRTRLGVLRGRAQRGWHVAPQHLAWVGRRGI